MSMWKGFAAGESEAQFRQTMAYLIKQQAGTPGMSASGVLSGLGVSQTATASGSVVVGNGMGLVQSSLTTGLEPLVSNADETLDVFTGSPVGALPRNDIVVFDASTATLRVLVGTANASPTDPSYAGWQLPLARLRHAANATTIPTAKIDDLRQFTTLNITLPQWQTVTPVFTNTLGETLSIGDGSFIGRWRVSGDGPKQECTFHFKLTRGSTTNIGTGGSWAVQLPVPADPSVVATGVGIQAIGSVRKPMTIELVSSTLIVFNDVAGNRITKDNPGGTAASQAGHVYQGTFSYFVS